MLENETELPGLFQLFDVLFVNSLPLTDVYTLNHSLFLISVTEGARRSNRTQKIPDTLASHSGIACLMSPSIALTMLL